MTVRTPRGGTHRYFLAPVGLRLAANGTRGLDLRGGTGRGYLVGSGSQICLNGQLGYYKIDGETPLGLIPAGAIEKFAAPNLPAVDVEGEGSTSEDLPDPLPAVVEQAFQRRTKDRSADLHHLVSTAVWAGLTRAQIHRLCSDYPPGREKYAGKLPAEVDRCLAKVAPQVEARRAARSPKTRRGGPQSSSTRHRQTSTSLPAKS